MRVVPQNTHQQFFKPLLRIVASVYFAFAIGLSWQRSVLTHLSSPFNPPPASAYCSGVLLCGNYHNVCGSCPGGQSCNAGDICVADGSPCPCGDQCFPAGGGGSWAFCSGGSQGACMSTSCGGGTCHADGVCGWNSNVPTPTPGGGPPPVPGPGCSNCGQTCAVGTTTNNGGNINVSWENTSICNCGMSCAGWQCSGGNCFRPCYGAVCGGGPPPPPPLPRGVLNGRVLHDVNNNGLIDEADSYIVKTDNGHDCGAQYSRVNQGNIFIEYAGPNGVGMIPPIVSI